MYTMISLLFLLLGIVLLVSILMSTFNPDEQIAFANVEKLRATMDEVCFTGGEKTISFDLPQNTPKFTSVFTVMPIWIIRTNGDPNYVLYYEAYPAGDAVGWEVYQGMQNRLLAPLPLGYGDGTKGENDVRNYANRVKDLWKTRVIDDPSVQLQWSEYLEGISINNIILGSKRSDFSVHNFVIPDNPSSTPAVGGNAQEALKDLRKYGEWRDLQNPDAENPVAAEGDNAFLFNNYRGLSSFEKSSIKYQPCGDNSLCMKTREAVYKFPLRQCGDIKYIEMKYDARDRTKLYTYAGATLVVVGAGACILLTSGVCGLVAAGGAVSASTAATAVPVAPGVYAATTAAGETIPIFLSYTASGTAVATTTAAATTSGISLSAILSSVGRTGWWAAKGFITQLIKHPLRTSVITIGTGTTAGMAGWKVGEFVTTAFLSYKIQDFNIASDCSIKGIKIEKVNCDQLECSKVASYPIYKYGGDGKLTSRDANGREMMHYTCVEKIGDDIQDPSDATTGFGGGKCLRMTVEERPDGFCWTPDPYKDTWLSDSQAIASTLGFFPVNKNTAYIKGSSESAFVLKYYPAYDLESWRQFFNRRLGWGWPT